MVDLARSGCGDTVVVLSDHGGGVEVCTTVVVHVGDGLGGPSALFAGSGCRWGAGASISPSWMISPWGVPAVVCRTRRPCGVLAGLVPGPRSGRPNLSRGGSGWRDWGVGDGGWHDSGGRGIVVPSDGSVSMCGGARDRLGQGQRAMAGACSAVGVASHRVVSHGPLVLVGEAASTLPIGEAWTQTWWLMPGQEWKEVPSALSTGDWCAVMWTTDGVLRKGCRGGNPKWRSAWLALRLASWRWWWRCLLVMSTARDVATRGSGSFIVVGSGDTQIRIWRFVLVVVVLDASGWHE